MTHINIVPKTHLYSYITLLSVAKKVLSPLSVLWMENNYHKKNTEIEEELLLIYRAQKNPREFSIIYESYYEPIFRYINKKIEDYETTADITSQVFIKCLDNLHKFEYKGVPFSAWIYRIASNEVNQHFRKNKNNIRTVCIKSEHIDILLEEMEECDYEDKLEGMKTALSALKHNELQLIELRFFEGRAFKEIGYILGMNTNNAKIKTYRVIEKMKRLIFTKK